mmetsp:Transcript_16004/g.23744  ORF Transcript_16004/g.23744 Transcript_16004/m.23744 type:complete len:276 (-) Transcript_16004:1232-2059(-)
MIVSGAKNYLRRHVSTCSHGRVKLVLVSDRAEGHLTLVNAAVGAIYGKAQQLLRRLVRFQPPGHFEINHAVDVGGNPTQPKVHKLQVTVLRQHQIVRLDVSVDDSVAMQKLDRQRCFCDVKLGRRWIDACNRSQHAAAISSVDILHDQVQKLLRPKGKVKLYDVWIVVADQTHDPSFLQHSPLHVHVFDVIFAHNFNRVNCPRAFLSAQKNLRTATFAYRLNNLKIGNPYESAAVRIISSFLLHFAGQRNFAFNHFFRTFQDSKHCNVCLIVYFR